MIKDDFYNAGQLIKTMLNEGYGIKEISVNGIEYSGKLIKNIDFLTYVCIEFIYDEIMFVPYGQINSITLNELEDENE